MKESYENVVFPKVVEKLDKSRRVGIVDIFWGRTSIGSAGLIVAYIVFNVIKDQGFLPMAAIVYNGGMLLMIAMMEGYDMAHLLPLESSHCSVWCSY